MLDIIPQLSTTSYPVAAPAPMRLRTALVAIWLQPRKVLASLAYGSSWSWLAPIGLALLIFYGRLFTLALLHDPAVKLALVQGFVGILLGWPLCAALLYTLSKVVGGRPAFITLLILCAWATLPLTLRNVAQIIYLVTTGQPLLYPGLSGLLAAMDTTHWTVQLGQLLLMRLDLYTLWHLGLLARTVQLGAQISFRKAMFVIGLYALLTLFVSAVAILL